MRNRLFVFPLLLVWLFTLGGCTENDNYLVTSPPPGPPPYKSLKSRDDVLFNLEKAYNEENSTQFERLLDDNFTFFFSQNDIDDPTINVPIDWDKGREITSASNMFNGYDPPGTDAVSDIDLYLTYSPGENQWGLDPGAPGNHPGEDWYAKTVTYNMAIDLEGPDTYLSTRISASFLIRLANVDGDDIWQIVSWRDDVLSSLVRASNAAAATRETTWGGIKALYSTSGTPPGASAPRESTWGAIKSLY